MKIETLERITLDDLINNPIGTANKINRNTLRIERAFTNAFFRDTDVENDCRTPVLWVDNELIHDVRIHEYDDEWPNLPLPRSPIQP